MTPAARIQAVIDLLDDLLGALESDGPSLGVLARRYFAKRRYAGSSDRRQVGEITYEVLRDFQNLAWRLEAAGGGKPAGRILLVAHLVSKEEDLAAVFSGEKYAPQPLDDAEQGLVEGLKAAGDGPAWARLNCPRWLYPAFDTRFGADLEAGLKALNGRAPIALRANRLKGDREAAIEVLRGEGVTASPCRFADSGLIVDSGPNVSAGAAYREGLIEVQDEGSQIAAALVDARPGMRVVDFCAGAGGKTLALAAVMQNQGRLIASDVAPTKLSELEKRARRAGATMIEVIRLKPRTAADERAEQLETLQGLAGRVLVDAPCSGSGTWRRQPELRLRYYEAQLSAIAALQGALLDEAAALVAPGGRLIYVTCSLLAAENEAQTGRFLERHPDWKALDWKEIWASRETAPAPESLSSDPACLQLAPHLHGCDGFFVSIFEAPSGLSSRDRGTIMDRKGDVAP